MKFTNEALGGYNQSQKIYYCETCNSIGRGARMISNHLQGCTGMKRKTKKSTEELKHRLEEAKANTREWKINKLEEETKALFKQLQLDAIRDVESMREINREVMEDLARTWLTKIF